MTVHGAKGLEAPIVILADTTTPPQGLASSRGCCNCRRDARRDADRIVWVGRKADDIGADGRGARARRARSRGRIPAAALCGDDARHRPADRVRRRRRSTSGRTAAGTTWSRGALEGRCIDRAGRRRRRQGAALPQDAGRRRVSAGIKGAGAGAHFAAAVADARRRLRRPRRADHAVAASSTTPRRVDAGRTVRRRGAAARADARQHRAPADAIAARHSAGPRGPRRRGAISCGRTRISATPSAARSSTRSLAVLDGHALRRAVRARQPGRGSDRRPHRGHAASSGQVDRLVVTPHAILIADYKTNRPAPRSLAKRRSTTRAM